MTTTTTLNLTTASPSELRAECDRLGLTYRSKDDRKTLTRKIVGASSVDDVEQSSDEHVDEVAARRATAASRVERMKLAQIEAKAMKAWRKAGAKGTPPATPNLDVIDAETATGPRKQNGAKKVAATKRSVSKRSTSTSTRGANVTPTGGLRFYRDGKPYNDRDNGRLSNVAARAKVSSADLRAALGDRKLDKPFAVTLSNGVKLELRAE